MGAAVVSYLILLLLSILGDRRYKDGASYRGLLMWSLKQNAPAVTILAPAKNEEPIIKPSVAALLAVPYPNLKVVIIDDGSKDRTFDILKETYQLVETTIPPARLTHKAIESVWLSKSEPRLTVVRKQSAGSKGDANNAGLEVVTTKYVLVTDVDSTIEHDCIQKMVVRLQETNSFAVGCSLRPLNGCTITKKGVKIALPSDYWSWCQVGEYLRTFMFRMGWAQAGMVFNISGAAGLFITDSLFTIGGYRSDTPAEDLASTWSYHALGMKIDYEPSANIYTQVPDSMRAMGSQRKRWARGLFQNLMFPRAVEILFSGKRQAVLIAWLWLFECLEPFVEAAGIVWIGEKVYTHTMPMMGWYYLLGALVLCPVLSIASISQMERNYRRLSLGDIVKLAVFSFIELAPLKLPIGLWWRIQGTCSQLTGNRTWEPLPRQQFKEEKACAI